MIDGPILFVGFLPQDVFGHGSLATDNDGENIHQLTGSVKQKLFIWTIAPAYGCQPRSAKQLQDELLTQCQALVGNRFRGLQPSSERFASNRKRRQCYLCMRVAFTA